TRIGLYVASVLAMGGAFLIGRWLVAAKLGRVLLALKDAESRVRFLGWQADHAKLFVFTLSAVLARLAGGLYVPQVSIIHTREFSPANSIEVAIWVAVGGRGTLIGAILGAGIVNGLKSWLTGAAPDLWLFVLGGLFIAVTLLIPDGVIGLARKLR